MIRYFSKQVRRLNRDEGGQSLVFIALVLLVLVAFLAVVVNVGHQVNTKIEIQNTADAAAVSGAAWLARGYNLVAGLNQGMVYVVGAILTIIATWVLLTVCVGIPVIGAACAPLWSAYNFNASKVIRSLWGVSQEMGKLQNVIVKVFPVIAEAEVIRISKMNKSESIGIPYPFDPRGNPEAQTTLTLHLERGSFADILKKLHIPEKVVEIAGIDEMGNVKGETTETQEIGRDDYEAAIEFEEGGKYQGGHLGRKVEKKKWYYDHKSWSLRKVLDDAGTCLYCERDLQEDEPCKRTSWKRTDYLKSEQTCCGGTFLVEEWRYCKFKVTITAKREVEAPSKIPQPMKLSPLFLERDWLAAIVTDKGGSAEPVFLPGFFKQKNPWGTLGIAQARVLSEKTEPGDMLYEMDWDVRLTKITALEPIFERLDEKGATGETLRKAAEKMMTH